MIFFFYTSESPKWLYNQERFKESKEIIKEVAEFNGVQDEFIKENILDIQYDKEVALEQIKEDDGKSIESKIGIMNQSQYYKNLVLLTITWSVSGMGYFLCLFLTKQFEGNIFVNFYLDGLAGIIGLLLGLPIYYYCKIRWTFILGFGLCLLFSIFLLLFEQGYINAREYSEDRPEERESDLRIIVPLIVFILKVC